MIFLLWFFVWLLAALALIVAAIMFCVFSGHALTFYELPMVEGEDKEAYVVAIVQALKYWEENNF